jgi:hypothetical protein
MITKYPNILTQINVSFNKKFNNRLLSRVVLFQFFNSNTLITEMI